MDHPSRMSVASPNANGPATVHCGQTANGSESDSEQTSYEESAYGISIRAVSVGLLIGVVICVSNIYFGLQIGWSAQMSMQSSLLSFVIFKTFSRGLRRVFRPPEHVLVQTVAGAVGCMPITAGLLGVAPALEYLLPAEDNGPLKLGYVQLLLWSLGLCLFGLIWGMMLRQQMIVREKLPWPGAVATATMIKVLHAKQEDDKVSGDHIDDDDPQENGGRTSILASGGGRNTGNAAKVKGLVLAASSSSIFSLLGYFVPMIHDLPVFGNHLAKKWLWTVNLSPGFVGSGIITGLVTPLHMLAGSVVGWAILSPLAKSKGWAPGEVGDWEHGSRGWIMWPSLAALMTDCLIKLSWLVVKPTLNLPALREFFRTCFGLGLSKKKPYGYTPIGSDDTPDSMSEDESSDPTTNTNPGSRNGGVQHRPAAVISHAGCDDGKADDAVGSQMLGFLLLLSVCICSFATKFVFGEFIPTGALVVAIALSLPLSIMGIRATAETDWNPVSGIGKVSQLVFAFLIPRSNPNRIIINLVAGALAEAGASQAGDVSHDLKIGHIIGARAQDQFYGQIIGSVAGSFIACGFYKLYTSVYQIPGEMFQIPVSHVWLLAAKLVTGSGLPEYAAEFTLAFAIFFSVATALKIHFAKCWWQDLIPGGVAFAVGMYNPPSFSIARAIGGVIYWYCVDRLECDRDYIIVIAGGLVLGEGITSMLNLGLTAAGVPHLGR